MMSLDQIRTASDEAAVRAASESLTPYVFDSPEELERGGPLPFPQLGDHEPDGWAELPDLRMFVDNSGFGGVGEAAMTQPEFLERVAELIREDPARGFAIGDVGQFQLYVKVYQRMRPGANAEALALALMASARPPRE